jgi:DNA-directed RNA polymerase subunit RPC12/RpoP
MAHKIENKLVDFKLEAEVPGHAFQFRSADTAEKRMKLAEDWLRDLKDFLNQHKDHPGLDIWVVPVRKDVCSDCEREWEKAFDPDTEEYFCVHCGKTVDNNKS